ncbi:MAG TPA: hypothetical protein VN931_03855 [Fibrobacteria bacterium]|nr:hypothetical protein [Fibrobacteria bacterium]
MFWILVGIGALVGGGNTFSSRGDSAGIAELRSHLPQDLRARVEKVREEMENRHDTLLHLTLSARTRWTDSLVREVLKRRSLALDTLAPTERERIEERMQEMEFPSGTRSRPARPRDPGMGLRQ